MSTLLSPAFSSAQASTAPLWQPSSLATASTGRKGGILLKPSSPTSTSVPLPVPMSGSPAGSHESLPSNASTTSDPRSPITPAIPANNLPPPPPIASRKIKFAPLPDPRTFQRSLSTGRNIKFAATLGPGGERSTQLQEQGVGRQGEADDSALTDDDDDDDDGDGQEDRVRRSSLLGSSWGKSTKKILTLGLSSSSSSGSKNLARTSSLESNVGSDISRSLSNLTRSLTPSSPALNGSSRDKKRRPSSTSVDLSATQQKLLASLSPTTPTTSRDRSSSPSGREGGSKRYSASSLDPADASMLSTSPRSPVGIKLLNGKVYGGRGREAIEKAEQEALKGEDFREWTSSGGMGSVSRSGGPDEDDGSGMAWLKKRREAREKEERERQQDAAFSSSLESTSSSSHAHQDLTTRLFPNYSGHPAISQRPEIGLSTIVASNAPSPGPEGRQPPEIIAVPPTPISPDKAELFPTTPIQPGLSLSDGSTEDDTATNRRSSIHDVHTIVIPGRSHPSHGHSRADGSEHATVQAMGIASAREPAQAEDEALSSDEDDDNDEDAEDDDDEEEDEEEDRLTEEARRTAQGAGIEVLSRHKTNEE